MFLSDVFPLVVADLVDVDFMAAERVARLQFVGRSKLQAAASKMLLDLKSAQVLAIKSGLYSDGLWGSRSVADVLAPHAIAYIPTGSQCELIRRRDAFLVLSAVLLGLCDARFVEACKLWISRGMEDGDGVEVSPLGTLDYRDQT